MVQCIGQIKVTSAAGKMSTDFNSEIQAELAGMGPEQQQRVLEFVRALRGGHGTPGTDLLAFAGTISKGDLRQMEDSIEQECEQVDLNEW
jgi:hypothetical protein